MYLDFEREGEVTAAQTMFSFIGNKDLMILYQACHWR